MLHFMLGTRKVLANVSLDQNALLADFDLNRARTTMRVSRLDL